MPDIFIQLLQFIDKIQLCVSIKKIMNDERRSGTINYGVYYEDNMAALTVLELALDDSVEDFWLGSNLQLFGAFDDIVIRIQYKDDPEAKLYAMQLKHQSNPTLHTNEFNKSKGSFSLKKYKEDCFKCIKHQMGKEHIFTVGVSWDNVILCLFTNAKIEWKIHDFPIDYSMLTGKKAFVCNSRIFRTQTEGFYKFSVYRIHRDFLDFANEILQKDKYDEIIQITTTNKKLFQRINFDHVKTIVDHFQEHLQCQLSERQTNIDQMIMEVSVTLKAKYNWIQIVDYVANYFRNLFKRALLSFNALPSDWEEFVSFVEAQGRELDIYKNVDSLIVEEIILCLKNKTDYSKELSEQIVSSVEWSHENSNRENIKQKVDNIIENLLYKYKITKRNEYTEFFERFRFYDNQIDYEGAKKSIASRIQNSFQLDDFKYVPEFIDYIANYFREKRAINKKQVKLKLLELLLDGDLSKNVAELKTKYQWFQYITDLNDYNQRMSLLKQIKISLQGKNEVDLCSLTGREFHEQLSSTFLLQHSCGKVIKVGKDLESIESNYIERKFYKVFLRKDILWETRKNIFIFDSCINVAIRHRVKVRNLSEFEKTKHLDAQDDKNIALILGSQDVLKDVEKLQDDTTFADYGWHHMKETSTVLEWIESWSNVKELNNFIVETDSVNEEDILTYFNNSINMISALPGMGKSTTLTSLLWHCASNKLSVRINLNEYIENTFEEFLSDFSNHIIKKIRSGNDLFESEITAHLIQKGKIILFLDALDEISPDYTEHVFRLITKFTQENLTTWVTTRPIVKLLLQERFNIMSINITEFTEENARQYLTKHPTVTEEEAYTILNKTPAELIKLPLHVNMLCLISRLENVNIKSLELSELYKYVIDLKIDIHYKKKYGLCRPGTGTDKRTVTENILSLHKIMALSVVYGTNFLIENKIVDSNNIQAMIDEIYNFQNHVGLVVGMYGNTFVFCHKTYAEYLVADWLSTRILTDLGKTMYEILFTPKFESVRRMFDRITSKKCPIHLAVLDGDADKLYTLCNTVDAKGTYRDIIGRTPLHLAVGYILDIDIDAPQHKISCQLINEIIQLCNREKLIYQQDALKWGWLQYLILSGSIDFCHNSCRTNLFLIASYWGYIDILRLLLNLQEHELLQIYQHNKRNAKQGDVFRDTNKSEFYTSLQRTCFNCYGCVELLTNYNYNYQALKYPKSYFTNIALHFAVERGYLNIIELLSTNGVKLDLETTYGKNVLHFAAQHGHLDVIELLHSKHINLNKTNKDGWSALHYASINRAMECFEFLVNNGVKLDLKTAEGKAALHFAAERGYLDKIELLHRKHANLNITNKEGWSALHYASVNNARECIEFLISNGTKLDLETTGGETVLHFAAERGYLNIIELLNSKHVNLNTSNKKGWSALHYAVVKGATKCVEFLINNGVHLGLETTNGKTALHFAARYGHLDIIELLHANHVSLDTTDKRGHSALHYALSYGNVQCSEFLIKNGAKLGK